MVFTCLSHDIIAHETTHALLDGMHRRYLTPTNPDVRAFHEAFADIVSLFQHFTFPEILQHQIAATRGSLRAQESLLGQLAGQFGRALGRRGALRDAIGTVDPETGVWKPRTPDPTAYATTMEAHERGAILVAAVFDAFLSIYERRTADLIRLATGGSGLLQPGAIHPDLVARLAQEAARSAQHVLLMCIRALDYCPPVDITFGEYLRAIITADTDAVADDDLRYRVAFVEAFRKWGIYPRDLRTLSEDSLMWRTPDNDETRPSQALQDGLERVRDFAQKFLFAQGDEPESRERTFKLQYDLRLSLHRWLAGHFKRPCGWEEGRRVPGPGSREVVRSAHRPVRAAAQPGRLHRSAVPRRHPAGTPHPHRPRAARRRTDAVRGRLHAGGGSPPAAHPLLHPEERDERGARRASAGVRACP